MVGAKEIGEAVWMSCVRDEEERRSLVDSLVRVIDAEEAVLRSRTHEG
jgi:hypothetical protein